LFGPLRTLLISRRIGKALYVAGPKNIFQARSTRRRSDPSGSGDVAHQQLSRRERQIMDVLYRLGEATVAEVVAALEEGVS
jgi:hypothetical protein